MNCVVVQKWVGGTEACRVPCGWVQLEPEGERKAQTRA